MKIAIVVPSPVPFTIGGAENLVWGLCETINKFTEHQAEIIKLPSKEHDFWDLIDNYYNFYKLDLDHFDMVITTKYPSWMVQHKNSICYMIHPLRGLYDTYHLMNQPLDVSRSSNEINKILDYMDNNLDASSLDEFFNMLFKLKENIKYIPKEFFHFPGSFIRKIIHYMDSYALSTKKVKDYFAISKTVKNRKDYFPTGTNVEVVYPPSTLKKFSQGEYQHIFMISRLDAPKRIDMLIRAMKYVESDVKVFIAGTGPQSDELKKLAKGDERIKLLGYISDDEAESYYANSLVIPYFPYDEDYGLVTIEAMMHKKPVITTYDAGGPMEFVIDGTTGFITKFNEKDIAQKIEYFVKNPVAARKMGKNGHDTVININWSSVVNALLKGVGCINKKMDKGTKRSKISLAVTFPIYPPLNGGQVRIYNLYKALAKKYDLDVISITSAVNKSTINCLANNIREICISKSEQHIEKEWKMEKKVGLPVSDVSCISLLSNTPEFEEKLKEIIEESEMVFLSHPYLYRIAKKYIGNRALIYEAQDVEFDIKKGMFPQNAFSKNLLEDIYSIERECCANSSVVMTCSETDKNRLCELYDIDSKKIIVVPNGVDISNSTYVNINERLQNKIKFGLENETIGLFMGSWHKPNLEACEEIIKIALKCPNVKFLLMGSQCENFNSKKLPVNIGLLGVVSDEVKQKIFSVVDFALNPMLSGSGTNLKMFDYMAAGLPIITTEFGTRGIDNKNLFIMKEVEFMAEYIQGFRFQQHENKIKEAEIYVKSNYDWATIGDCALNQIRTLLN